MKTFLMLPFVLTLPVFAGTSAKEAIAPAPAPNPCLLSWFAGGSVGYLTELEEPMYNAHIGLTNSCWVLGGFNVSTFLEVGYTEKDWSDSGSYENYPYRDTTYEDHIDLTIVPITLNVKFERALTGNLNAYFGAGLGMAWMDIDMSGSETDYANYKSSYDGSDSDWVFTAQVFAGLSYNFTPNFAMYGGARWIYLDDPTFWGESVSIDDDWLLELGLRFKF